MIVEGAVPRQSGFIAGNLRPLRGRWIMGVIGPGGVAALNHRLIAATPPGSVKACLITCR